MYETFAQKSIVKYETHPWLLSGYVL